MIQPPSKVPSSSRALPKEAAAASVGTVTAESLAIAPVGAAHREVMIREAAYFRAEHRGFATGSELEDWLTAEREIDNVLAQKPAAHPAPKPARLARSAIG
jgi:hypothetical protein